MEQLDNPMIKMINNKVMYGNKKLPFFKEISFLIRVLLVHLEVSVD